MHSRRVVPTLHNLELVLDDFSEDNTRDRATRAIGQDARARILPGVPRLKDGWESLGLSHPPTARPPGCCSSMPMFDSIQKPFNKHSTTQTHAPNGLSVFGRLTFGSFWEWVVQPVIGANSSNNDPKRLTTQIKNIRSWPTGSSSLLLGTATMP